MKKRPSLLLIALTFIIALTLVSCQDEVTVPTPTQVVVRQATVAPTGTKVPLVEPTTVAVTPVPAKTMVPEVTATSVVPTVVVTAMPDEGAVVGLIKPGVPEFVLNSGLTACSVNIEYSNAVGADVESGFTSTSWQPAFDNRYDTVVFSRNGSDNFVSYYVRGSGDSYVWPAANKTYIIVRFNAGDCGIQTLIDWAINNLEEAEAWVSEFDAWLEASHQSMDAVGDEPVLNGTAMPVVKCEFDDPALHAYFKIGPSTGDTNSVYTNPQLGNVEITSHDQTIEVHETILDTESGCNVTNFRVPEHSGPMGVAVTIGGHLAQNINYHDHGDIWGPDGHSFDAP